jgi:hypothetical protein
MKLVDLNILLHAVNRYAREHAALLGWWEKALAGDEPIGLTWFVLVGFLRVSTSPRVFAVPLTVEEAIRKVETWLVHENTRLLAETDEHWRIFSELLREAGVAGNLNNDAHLGAMAVCHGATLVSCDSDFGRFRRLRWENPLG